MPRIYIIGLESQGNIEGPEQVQHDGQDDEQRQRIWEHQAAQRADAGLFIVFLAINNDQGVKSKHRRADVDGRVADAVRSLSQFRRNADGHEHGHKNRRQDGPLRRSRRNEQVEQRDKYDDAENRDLRRQGQGF